MNCAKCNENVTDSVFCNQCKGNLHYGCAGVAETTYRKMKHDVKSSWRCVQCRTEGNSSFSGSLSSSSFDNKFLQLLNEVKAVRQELMDEVKAVRTEVAEVNAEMKTMSQSIATLTSKWSDLETRFIGVEDRLIVVESQMSSISKLQSDLASANNTVTTLQNENNEKDQYLRMNNVEISGVPYSKGENLMTILRDICSIVGLKLNEADIDSIHRVRRFDSHRNDKSPEGSPLNARIPSIIVKFTRRMGKDQLLAAVRARRGLTSADIGLSGPASVLYLGDHLTPRNKLLRKKARELKKELLYEHLWTRDCKIFMRKTDSSKILLISNESDLSKIK